MLRRIGVEACITSEDVEIRDADRLILPGVGAFDRGMRGLEERGLRDVLTRIVMDERKPVLGICLGMQLLTSSSEEGELPGLGWIAANTRRFRLQDASLKVPQMRWNTVQPRREHPLWHGIVDDHRFYFVHSYYVECHDDANVLGETKYGNLFTSAIVRDNIIGVQFHPEKSHRFGMELLQNFAERC